MTTHLPPHLPVHLRPADQSDTADVLELTSHIWEGEDYVPRVWQEWLADQDGLLAVAKYQDHVVGLGKLTRLTNEDWWMEGLRVHPNFEGRGIASQLHEYLLHFWEQHAQGALRLATSSERLQVHKLCERTGFLKIGEYGYYQAPKLTDLSTEFTISSEFDLQDVLDRVSSPGYQVFPDDLIDLGWQWAKPSKEILATVYEGGQAYRWFNEIDQTEQFTFYWLDDWENNVGLAQPLPMVMLLVNPANALETSLLSFRKFAAIQGWERVGWLAPKEDDILHALRSTGFEPAWEGTLYLFEK